MKQLALSKWLKFIIIGVGLCGVIIYACLVPIYGKSLVDTYPELESWFYPWLIFIWLTAIPCYIGFVFAWKIASNIGKDRSFTMDNAKYLKWISILAASDSFFVFFVDIIYLFLNINHPGMALLLLFIVFGGITISIASAVLSHMVVKAAKLQEQSDLTI